MQTTIANEDNNRREGEYPILDTPFYIYHKGKEIWIGVSVYEFTDAYLISEADFIDRLREELGRSNATPLPKFLEEIE